MIKCRKCGGKVQEGKYCSNCGAKLNNIDAIQYKELCHYMKSCNHCSKSYHILFDKCFEMALALYPEKINENNCPEKASDEIISLTFKLFNEMGSSYIMILRSIKKPAKAGTNAD